MLAREGGGGVDDTSGIGDLGGLVFFKKRVSHAYSPGF